MASKSRVKALLKRGNLSGYEAAQLVLLDSWERDHDRDGFLTDAEVAQIRQGLTGQQAEEYNRWVDLYRSVEYTVRGALISGYYTLRILERARWMGMVYLEEIVERKTSVRIVTAAEYEAIKAEALEKMKARPLTLEAALYNMALEASGKKHYPEIDGWLYPSGDDERPGVSAGEASTLLNAIRSGRLKPGKMTRAEEERLEELQALRAAHREKDWKAMQEEGVSPLGPLHTIDEETASIMAGVAGRPVTGKALQGLLAILEEIVKKGPTEARLEKLDPYYVTAGTLQGAGLPGVAYLENPEWGVEIDVAILHEPAVDVGSYRIEELTDDRGFFQGDKWAEVARPSRIVREILSVNIDKGESAEDNLRAVEGKVTRELRGMMAAWRVLELISDLIGIPFTEDLGELMDDIERTVDGYNTLCSWPIAKNEALPFSKIKLEEITPSDEALQHLRERFSPQLGRDWWEEIGVEFIRDFVGHTPEEREELRKEGWA